MRKRTPAQRWFDCRVCGVRFERLGPGRAPLYCTSACRKTGRGVVRKELQNQFGPCAIDECKNRARSRTALWCEAHYHLNYRNGGPTTTKIRVPNGKCHHCAVPMTRKALFCDALCKRRFRMGAPGRQLVCISCDKVLAEGFNLGSLYCSRACKSLRDRASKYGLSVVQLRALLDDAKGCAVCHRADAELVIDHCHSSGRIRGVLCSPCNVGIGMLAESPTKMLAAIDYLRQHLDADVTPALF